MIVMNAKHIEAELVEIIGHLGAAKMQRAASDDRIIAEHIDAALEIASAARRALLAQAAA